MCVRVLGGFVEGNLGSGLTAPTSAKDDEWRVPCMIVAPETCGICSISKPSKAETCPKAKIVQARRSHKAEHKEDGVKCNIGHVGQVRILLPCASKEGNDIVHAHCQEQHAACLLASSALRSVRGPKNHSH